MRGDEMDAVLVAQGKGKPVLQQVHVVGNAMMHGQSVAGKSGGAASGLKETSVAGDDLLLKFVAAGSEARAAGHAAWAGAYGVARRRLRWARRVRARAMCWIFDLRRAAGGSEQVAVGSATQRGM